MQCQLTTCAFHIIQGGFRKKNSNSSGEIGLHNSKLEQIKYLNVNLALFKGFNKLPTQHLNLANRSLQYLQLSHQWLV
jgi:hypothetical protein